ncbi:MAG: rRNA maturation RNase YbeY, partial [Pedobacter sp.]
FYTDIITFDLSESSAIIGEVYVSLDRVKDNAVSLSQSFEQELLRVVFHGALHLCGYKDKTEEEQSNMRAKEDFYLNQFKNF